MTNRNPTFASLLIRKLFVATLIIVFAVVVSRPWKDASTPGDKTVESRPVIQVFSTPCTEDTKLEASKKVSDEAERWAKSVAPDQGVGFKYGVTRDNKGAMYAFTVVTVYYNGQGVYTHDVLMK